MTRDVIPGGYKCDNPGCDWVGNSRQAKFWHKRNACTFPARLASLPEPVVALPAAAAPVMAPTPLASAAGPLLTPREQFEQEHGVKIPDLDAGDPDLAEQEPLADDDFPFVLMLPIIAVILLIAGIVIFREKIIALWRGRGGKPPAYGVPDYPGGVSV